MTTKLHTNGRGAAHSPDRRRAISPRAPRTRVEPVEFDHEQLVIRRGRRSGAHVIVAIHSTVLGPALGGVRLWRYEGVVDGARDALRLARGMTHKAAAAGLDLGGGKGVICSPSAAPPSGAKRRALLLDFGDLVDSLGGRYVTAEDVGIAAQDLVPIAERTDHVTGLPPDHGGVGDPSPLTALGVEAAIRACLSERFGHREVAGHRIAVVGLGHVGEKLARRLAQRGAELVISDIDFRKRRIAAKLGARWVAAPEAMLVECDVLAPCALGGAIDAKNAGRLRCAIVCGSANNQLAAEGLAEVLANRDILYAPDFIVNAGGLIQVYGDIRGYSQEQARELALGIETNTERVLAAARERAITPLEAASELADERLGAARPDRAVIA